MYNEKLEKNLSMTSFKFIDTLSGDYEHIIVGGLSGLINALNELKPSQFIRTS